MPLGERLAMYRQASSALRPDFAKAYDELVARLAVLDRGEVGPQIGEKLEEFHLPDDAGRLVSLSSLLRSGPAVISINRGHWCPYCKLELRSLAAVHDQIRELGASIVSIMPDVAEHTGGYSRANELPFPLLSDVDLGYSLSLGRIGKEGASFKSLGEPWADTTTPHGRLMLTVLAGVAEFERALILERTNDGRARAKAEGKRFGRTPKLTGHQAREALRRLEAGESTREIALSYSVAHLTICRLKSRHAGALMLAPCA